jgi:hypothetical protein
MRKIRARSSTAGERDDFLNDETGVSAKNKSRSLREFHKFLAQLPRSKSQTIGIIKACCVNNSQIKQSYNENETILNWESMYKWPSLSGPPRSFRPQRTGCVRLRLLNSRSLMPRTQLLLCCLVANWRTQQTKSDNLWIVCAAILRFVYIVGLRALSACSRQRD